MTLGALILFGLVVAEVATVVKVSNQAKRIDKLEEKIGKPKKKE
jgi:hypothetical protein